jgi:hypothetical protein
MAKEADAAGPTTATEGETDRSDEAGAADIAEGEVGFVTVDGLGIAVSEGTAGGETIAPVGGAPGCAGAIKFRRAIATNPKMLASAAIHPRPTDLLARSVVRAWDRHEGVRGCCVAGWGGGASDGPANPTLESVPTSSKTSSSGRNSSTATSTSSSERNSAFGGFRCGERSARIVDAARRGSGGGADRAGFGRGGGGISKGSGRSPPKGINPALGHGRSETRSKWQR